MQIILPALISNEINISVVLISSMVVVMDKYYQLIEIRFPKSKYENGFKYFGFGYLMEDTIPKYKT